MAVVSSQHAQLRDAPNKKGAKITSVPRKAKVEIVETMGEWLKVKVQDGTVGWMHESTLILPD
jgi:SH3-like domain-containing protein